MTDSPHLRAVASTLDSATDPAIALAAIDLAGTAAGLLLGGSQDVPLLGCSAAIVSLDAAYAELRHLDDPDADLPPPALARETPEDVPAVVTAVLGLITATAHALRRIIAHTDDADTARACSRAVLQLDLAAGFLRDDLP